MVDRMHTGAMTYGIASVHHYSAETEACVKGNTEYAVTKSIILRCSASVRVPEYLTKRGFDRKNEYRFSVWLMS